MNIKGKTVIKGEGELERAANYCLSHDISLSILEDYYNLTYLQKKFLLEKSIEYSRQQDELVVYYNTLDVSPAYLEVPNAIEANNKLDYDVQIELFKRLDEIDKEHIRERLRQTNNELSKVSEKLSRLSDKYGNEMQLCDLYKEKNSEKSLKDILARDGFKEDRIELICEKYATFVKLRSKKKKLIKERDELLKKRRDLIDNNIEYARIIDILVTCNVKLVNKTLRIFFKNVPLPKEEAQAYALEGLSKAINNFDYTRGYCFSTYAIKVMYNHVKRHFKSMIGISWRDYCMKRNIAYCRKQLASYDKDRTLPITPKELADSGLVNYSARQIAELDEGVDVMYNFSDVYALPDDSEICTKKDMPVEQEDYDFIDAMEEIEEIPVYPEGREYAMDLELLRKTVEEVLPKVHLTDREEKIIRLRFGFDDGRTRTLEEIAQEFHVTASRIGQQLAKALRKLRSGNSREKLLPFTEDYERYVYRLPSPSKEEVISAFMKLKDLSSFDYKTRAFFISTNTIRWDEEEVRKLASLLACFNTNISLASYAYPVEKIVFEFCRYFDSYEYMYKYPYEDIYEELRRRLGSPSETHFREEILEDLKQHPENVLKLALSTRC